MKTYDSKHSIYNDYSIALKFGLERRVHVRDYDGILDALARDCRATVSQFSCSVKNYNSKYPISAGFFVETTVQGATGKDLGVQFVLLEHETGWEWFLPMASAVAVWIGLKIGDKTADIILDAASARIAKFMTQAWPRLIHGGVRIDHVEIRTRNKGVMRVSFDCFHVTQIACLMKNFNSIGHLRDCNQLCFNGSLVAPPDRQGSPQADD